MTTTVTDLVIEHIETKIKEKLDKARADLQRLSTEIDHMDDRVKESPYGQARISDRDNASGACHALCAVIDVIDALDVP